MKHNIKHIKREVEESLCAKYLRGGHGLGTRFL